MDTYEYYVDRIEELIKQFNGEEEMPARCIINLGGEYTYGCFTIGLNIHNLLNTPLQPQRHQHRPRPTARPLVPRYGRYQAITQLLVLLGHVFPIAARHVFQLFARIHTLLDTNGLKVGAPEILKKLVVAAEHVGIKLAVLKTKGNSGFILKGDMNHLPSIIIIPIMALCIVNEPRLVIETILEMINYNGQHVMIGTDHTEIGAVLGFLETDELLHP